MRDHLEEVADTAFAPCVRVVRVVPWPGQGRSDVADLMLAQSIDGYEGTAEDLIARIEQLGGQVDQRGAYWVKDELHVTWGGQHYEIGLAPV